MDMKRMTTARLTAAALATAMMGAIAHADTVNLRTPSDNIHCAYDDDGTSYIRCDIMNFTRTLGQGPADCDLEWGDAFEIGPGYMRGEVICHGDTVRAPDAIVLGYGKTFAQGGLSCVSEKSGLTCRNKAGHGFFLSRARQKVF
jgi:hypothetical protein